MPHAFLGGVVEGFYGQPWTNAQRQKLFQQMSAWGLNTYFYAPKDDLKHRAIWRDAYLESELAGLAELIEACRQQGLMFLYGLSPGLDIHYSDTTERARIQRRFQQLIEVGCQHFALLFDDLPKHVSASDRRTFGGLAEAQSDVANDIHRWLTSRTVDSRFLFCPTPYCDRLNRSLEAESRRANPGIGNRPYLETLGEHLEKSIDVLWTGPEIVSAVISIDSIATVAARIQRPPVIWDNLHANDYDGQRLYTGPYSGRPLELKQHVGGILTNPNNEFVMNFVPIRTLAAYLGTVDHWLPRQAFLAAVTEWLDEFLTVGDPLTLGDLILLCDCYYLPHEYGPGADALLHAAEQALVSTAAEEHESRSDDELAFEEFNRRIQSTFDKLTQLRHRELFYAWSRRVWDLKEELQLIHGLIGIKKANSPMAEADTHLPGTYRGGMVARLRELLSIDQQGRIIATPRDRGARMGNETRALR